MGGSTKATTPSKAAARRLWAGAAAEAACSVDSSSRLHVSESEHSKLRQMPGLRRVYAKAKQDLDEQKMYIRGRARPGRWRLQEEQDAMQIRNVILGKWRAKTHKTLVQNAKRLLNPQDMSITIEWTKAHVGTEGS